jgi:hypothetical protein
MALLTMVDINIWAIGVHHILLRSKVSCARMSPIPDLGHTTMSRLRMQIRLLTYLKLRITHHIKPLEPFQHLIALLTLHKDLSKWKSLTKARE